VNYEFDMGIEKQYDNSSIKAKVFYSQLDDLTNQAKYDVVASEWYVHNTYPLSSS
jgi:hypothetical protein